ncbi:alpha/beta hydrolase [Actinokineospora sp. NBRC 105648]|uniref:alpha/beta hydrolase n=1 Tax=Actinokineospora sp. NBRC 105648 TaxID=3032206 RepID=UPI0024A3E122|nr:alpha/beta hydrolase [Actinokineospora sp. NBRC 105648]GLZ36905.1 peptidase [Actinokineospora sp. NBRC 105648]
MKKIVAAVAAAGFVVGGVVLAPGVQAAPQPKPAPNQVSYDPAPIAWGVCASPGLARRGAECGFLEVPLDYAKPAGTKIKLAVSRIKAKVPAEQYQGIMVTNPGGPGGSGLTLSVLGEFVPNDAGLAYDWIGFDPRGVGSSQPALSCDGNYFSYNRPYYVPATKQLEKTWLDRSKGYAQACDTAGGELLDHVKTTDTVNDIDVIRKALRQDKLNYYGFSYGTYLGQVYSTLYPERVRRMVLDGNVDARKVWYQANLDQDVAFDRNIKIYFDWVAKYDSVYHLGKSGKAVEAKFYAEQLKFIKNPAGGIIGPDEWTDIFLQAGYYVFGWEDVANAFSAWVNNGDYAGLKALYDASNGQGPGTDNGFAMYLATQCTDVQWPTQWSRWQVDNWLTFLRAPFETWGNAWFNAPCINWGGKVGKPVQVDGSKAPPILLIDETLDAATPYEGSLELRSRFPKSVLIEGVGGTTHSGSLNGVACTDNLIADYLASGKLPARKPGRRSDTQCDPVPVPVPAAVAQQRKVAAAPSVPGDITRADLQKLIVGARG